MRVPHLQKGFFIILLLMLSLYVYPIQAYEGAWIPAGEDFFTYFETLTGHNAWSFNTTRGPTDRWGINFTISGFGLHPTTLLVCDETAYQEWIQTGDVSQCLLVYSVNSSLHTVVDFPYQSQWHLVLSNTGSVTLYFSLRITHYQWRTPSQPPTNPVDSISSLFVYLIIIGLIVFVIIPCVCKFSCFGFFRRRLKKNNQDKEVHYQTTIVIMTPEQIEHYIADEEDH